MKKITLLFSLIMALLSHDVVLAQSDFFNALPDNNGAVSGNSRAPQGSKSNSRTHWIITPSEMAAAGYVNGDVINAIGFNYEKSDNPTKIQNITTTSTTFNVYMENTNDVANNKSTNWNTAISTMTIVGTNNITLPAAVSGPIYHKFSGGSKFTYTGGGLYIAFDYANTGTIAAIGNSAKCTLTLVNGLKSAQSANGTVPTTLSSSSYRPQTYLGIAVDCERPLSQTFSNMTSSSVDLTWTGSGSDFILEYGEDGFSLGTGTVVNVTGAKSLSLTDLKPSTVYQYYVKTNCGTSTSVNKGPYPFYTNFDVANVDYSTGFESYDFPFIGWKADSALNGTNWFIADLNWTSLNLGSGDYFKDGSKSIISFSSTIDETSSRVYSRGVNLTGGSEAKISYWVRKYATTTATGSSDYQLTVGSDQTVLTQTETVATETGITNAVFEEKTFTYIPATTGVYYFSFLNNSPIEPTESQYSLIIIDSFTVTQALSNNNFISSKFTVFPNPANDIVTISGSNVNFNAINVTDLNGRTVKNVSFEGVSSTQVSISDLSAGVYMMNIYSNEGVATKKLVKN